MHPLRAEGIIYQKEGIIMKTRKLLSALLALLLALALLPAAGATQKDNLVSLEVFSQSGLIETVQVSEVLFHDAPASWLWAAPPRFEVVKIIDNGPDSENIVLTIMGDGFTAAEQALFITKATELCGYLLGKHPFSSFQDVFNVYAIKVISNQSGAAENLGDTVDNYFGSKFYFDGKTERLLYTPYTSRVTELLNHYTPLYDMAALLVNSTKYGGAGGSISVISSHETATETLVHELGHSVGNLADEYWWVGREAPNMTKNNNPATIKWRHWLNVEDVGIYAFAEDEDPNWYRPHEYCTMRYLYQPFCGVCATELTRVMADMSHEAFHGCSGLINAILPGGTARIGDYMFYGCESLSTVTIPASVASIGRYAFLRCTNISGIFDYATVPQDITGNDIFYGIDRSKITLSVPEETEAAYLTAGWTGFKAITFIKPVTGVTISETAATLDNRMQLQLSAAIAPIDASNQNVSWGSSNSTVATVSASGLVTAVGKGTAAITVTTAEGAKTAVCTVTVLDSVRYIALFGRETKYEAKPLNWLLFIFFFGWIWMWF